MLSSLNGLATEMENHASFVLFGFAVLGIGEVGRGIGSLNFLFLLFFCSTGRGFLVISFDGFCDLFSFSKAGLT